MPRTTTPPETFAVPAVDDRALGDASLLRRLGSSRATWIFGLDLVLVLIFAAVVGPAIFLSAANAQSLALSGSQALILAIGLAMMLGGGAFDLSLGANLVLSSVVGAHVIRASLGTPLEGGQYENVGLAIALGVLACIGTGAVFGAVNGVLIAVFRLNSLIATLGTLGIGTGLALVLSGGGDIAGMPPALQLGFGLARPLGIPAPAIVAVGLALIFWAIVRYSRFGLRTLALGSSESAALRAGINVKRHMLWLAIIAGSLAGFAGFIDLAVFGSTSINGHANAALAAATAAVIGGTSIEGGRISIIGAIWGAALAVILQAGLVIAGVSSAYQLAAVGVVLLVAVGLDRFTTLRRRRG